MSQIVGFVLAIGIGVALGMLGGGGSILTVPVFVYVMGLSAKDAIAMSLPVVGATSLVGALEHWRERNVDWHAVAIFAPLAMAGALVGARIARLVTGRFQLLLLGGVMLMAGILMLRGRRGADGAESGPTRGWARTLTLGAAGLGVGTLTGLVGVGGGFLIVPSLVLLVGVAMKRAIGTSLFVISLSTTTAALGYRDQASFDWPVVVIFTALAIAGALLGTRAVRLVSPTALRRAFGVLIVVIALLLLYQNRTAGAL